MPNKGYYTYIWKDPKTDIVIYVGKGKKDRAYNHLRPSTKTRLAKLLRKRIKEGYSPEPVINFEQDEATAIELEKFWIDFFGREASNTGSLFNIASGGQGNSMPGDKNPNFGKTPWNKGRKCPGVGGGWNKGLKGCSQSHKGKPWTEERRKVQNLRTLEQKEKTYQKWLSSKKLNKKT